MNTSASNASGMGERAAILALWLMISVSLYLVFMWVPNEREMGAVQRIFYFHVGSAFATYSAIAVSLVASLIYLGTKSRKADAVNEAAAEVALVFCSLTLLTGMIWARPIWNTWFRGEPRLVSFLVLWMILFSMNLLRRFGERERIASQCAVLSIVSALTVPVVVFSIRLLPQVAQLHPQVVENRGLRDPRFVTAFWFVNAAVLGLQAYLIWIRTRIGMLERTLGVR